MNHCCSIYTPYTTPLQPLDNPCILSVHPVIPLPNPHPPKPHPPKPHSPKPHTPCAPRWREFATPARPPSIASLAANVGDMLAVLTGQGQAVTDNAAVNVMDAGVWMVGVAFHVG